jgi:4-amino-4-deoxy-L-arabinose transferase-like glycosyltransferase
MMLNRTTGVSILQHPIFLAILFFFLAMGINLIGIDLLSLTSDECFSIYHAQMSPRLIYHHLSTGNNPPLHEWILHYWMGWFGDSAFSVRLPSAIFSSLTTALIFILGTQISAGNEKLEKAAGNTSIGGIAALLFLASNYTTFLAHEARTYNLTLFLGVLSTICFVTAIRSGKTKHFLVYGLIGGLLCLSHFFGIWILLAQGSFWLRTNWRNPNALKKMGWAVLGFGIAFGWYVPNLWYRFVDSASQGTWVNPAPWDAPYFTLWKYLNTPIATIIAALLLLYLTINLAAKKSIAQKQNAQLILWLFALPFFGQWLLSLDHPFSIPMFTERYASITLPFLCLILAMALSGLREQYNQGLYRFALALFFSTLLSGKIFTPPNQASAKESLQTAKVSLGANWGKTPIILEPYHSAFQLLYYLDHQRFQQYHPESVYPHLANQLQQSNVWILKTNKTLDSTGLSNNNTLAYLRFGTEKSVHTIQIEQQLEKLTATGGSIKSSTIQIPKRLWGTTEISSEAEFWLIERK